jgi:acetyltransferase-like isoleucine patch superfamily enzyme
VNIRTGAIISKETIIEEDCFIGPGVITNHTRRIGEPPLKTLIGKGCIVGSQASILAGVELAPGTIIGAGAVVTRTIYKAGTYVGNPARRIK